VDSDRQLLAVRLPNWVGDVVMALPTLQQLQRSGFVLRAVGRSWAKGLLAGLSIPVTPAPKGIVPASRVLATLRTNRGLLFTNSLSSALAMRLAGIRAVGYRADWRRPLLHTALVKSANLHEVEHFWRLGQAAAACWGSARMNWPDKPPSQIHLPISNTARVEAAKALSLARIRGPFTVCCPMAVGTAQGQSKQWPKFVEFCRSQAAAGRTIVICPGPGEEDACEPYLPHVVVLRGLSLSVYAAVMACADAVLANDSGPMHMAAAVGVPVLGIFGPGDPVRTRPWGARYIGGAGQWPDLDSVCAAYEQLLKRDVRRIQVAA
jgi:heptosyltransferase-2